MNKIDQIKEKLIDKHVELCMPVGIQPACPSMSFLEWFEYRLDGGTDYFYEFKFN